MSEDRTVWEVITGGLSAKDAIVDAGEFDLLPASAVLREADAVLAAKPAREFMLRLALAGLPAHGTTPGAQGAAADYDYIVMDCGAHLGTIATMALAYATEVIVPLNPGMFELSGLGEISRFLELLVVSGINERAQISGILFTQYEGSTVLHRGIRENVELTFPELVYPQVIRKNVAIGEAAAAHRSVALYSPKSHGAEDYTAFVDHLITQEA